MEISKQIAISLKRKASELLTSLTATFQKNAKYQHQLEYLKK